MRRECLTVFSLCAGLILGLCPSSDAGSLEIKVQPLVSGITKSRNPDLDISVSFFNSGSEREYIRISHCNYKKQWVSDPYDLEIVYPDCLTDHISEELLMPGDVYKETITFHVRDNIPDGNLEFKVGFMNYIDAAGEEGRFESPVWSDTVSVYVEQSPYSASMILFFAGVLLLITVFLGRILFK